MMDDNQQEALPYSQAANSQQLAEFIELVKKTRGCHIQAEKRLLELSTLTDHANLYYGCLAAILTILTLNSAFDYLTIPSACFASAVALWAAYSSVEKYESRARCFYESYLSLQELWFDCEIIQNELGSDVDRDNQTIKDCHERYSRILHSTENHTEKDYWAFVYNKQRHIEDLRKQAEKHHRSSIAEYCIVRVLIYIVVPAMLLCLPRIIAILSPWLFV